MRLMRMAWAAWALVPVAGLAFHYGPGQRIYRHDLAVRLQETARQLEAEARERQEEAYALHLAALEARKNAFVLGTAAAEEKATTAAQAESEAFKVSSAAWKQAADAFGRIQAVAQDASPETLQKIRWSRSRALVRAGDIWTGIAELEAVLEEIEAGGKADGEMARATREEIASAYYYGARLLRLAGEPDDEWRMDSGKARQHFRYLAEQAKAMGLPREVADNHQRNVELVLDLEQASQWEIEGKALPKDSPLGRNGNRPGRGDKGKRKQPPQQRDGRGAGGAEEIYSGW